MYYTDYLYNKLNVLPAKQYFTKLPKIAKLNLIFKITKNIYDTRQLLNINVPTSYA